MAYQTLTYNQRDALILQPMFIHLQAYCTEIPTKKCLSVIPGLVSRSFQFINEQQAKIIQKQTMSKFYFKFYLI
jgi:hypothetical protein